MSVVRNLIAVSSFIGGIYAAREVMQVEKPFADMPAKEYRILERFDTDSTKNWISFEEGNNLLRSEFGDKNRNISPEGQAKAINFLARLWVNRDYSFLAPLNVTDSRFNILGALYEMSPDSNAAHRSLVETMQKLREEQK